MDINNGFTLTSENGGAGFSIAVPISVIADGINNNFVVEVQCHSTTMTVTAADAIFALQSNSDQNVEYTFDSSNQMYLTSIGGYKASNSMGWTYQIIYANGESVMPNLSVNRTNIYSGEQLILEFSKSQYGFRY